MSLKNPKTQSIHHSWSGCCWKAPGLLEPFLAVGTNAVFPTASGANDKGFPRKLPSRFLEAGSLLLLTGSLCINNFLVSNSECVRLMSNMYLVFQRYLLADHVPAHVRVSCSESTNRRVRNDHMFNTTIFDGI